MRYFAHIILILTILIAGCVGSERQDMQQNAEESTSSYQPTSTSSYDSIFENTKAQLQIAQKSGGISPESYEEIDGKIKLLESQGYETKELRELLSKLSVGGQSALNKSGTTENLQPEQNNTAVQQNETIVSQEQQKGMVTWDYNNGWNSTGVPPACPSLVFDSPVDVTKATAILYPGQIRGTSINDYKPHGGFRFDNQNTNDVEVRVPFDGYVWRGSKLIDFQSGNNIQYSFDIINECGIMHRVGHLYELSPEFQELADRLPLKEGDSSTTDLKPYVSVRKGDLIATKIGIPGNVGMDWGVYDLRKENDASKDSSYREIHKDLAWAAFHALCWLDYLPGNEQAIVKSLPGADGKSGKNSDYC